MIELCLLDNRLEINVGIPNIAGHIQNRINS
jgi:hypothetical protein